MRVLWTIFLISILIYGCTGSHVADVPTFINIEEVGFRSDPGQGSENQNLSEVWMYADSLFLGAYPVPSRIPVLGSGGLTLEFFAGIRENGQATSPVIYPMMRSALESVEAREGQDILITPVFQYREKVKFSMIEDFENGNQFNDDMDGDAETALQRTVEDGIEGTSAKATVSSDHPILEVGNSFPIRDLPDDGSSVFLEMEYRSDISLAVGRQNPSGEKFYKLILFPSLEAQKIYVNFTGETANTRGEPVKIIFNASFDPAQGKPNQEIIIDNLKLLHF